MSMRPNLKLFPQDEKSVCRFDRFSSEMVIHKSLKDAQAAIAERKAIRLKARQERRQRLNLELLEG